MVHKKGPPILNLVGVEIGGFLKWFQATALPVKNKNRNVFEVVFLPNQYSPNDMTHSRRVL